MLKQCSNDFSISFFFFLPTKQSARNIIRLELTSSFKLNVEFQTIDFRTIEINKFHTRNESSVLLEKSLTIFKLLHKCL